MIYDRIVEVFNLDTASSPLVRRLRLRSAHCYGNLTVYHRTYFQAVQAGEAIDRMIQIPAPAEDPPDATMYAVPEDGHVYKIREAQLTTDGDGLPVVNLSLHREEARYDLLRAGDSAEDGDAGGV